MQLKILISIICLILSSHSISTTKLLKNKETTSLSSVSTKVQKEKQNVEGSASQFTWTLVPAMKLFKEIALSVFDTKSPLDTRKCMEDIENNSELGPTPYRELWDKCVQINKEFFSKQSMESAAKGGVVAPDRLAALKAFSNWDDLIIGEFKALVGGSRNSFIKADCLPVFSKVRGNVYDLINILQKPEYMGMKFTGGKNDQFIDSQYSIYRQTITPGAFKRLNDASDTLMSAYNKGLSAVAAGKRGIPKAPGPYDSLALGKAKQNIIPVSLYFYLSFILFFIFISFFYCFKILHFIFLTFFLNKFIIFK